MLMEIATILNVHSNPKLIIDTLDSISTYVGENILIIIDGASKELDNVKFPATSIKGFYHNYNKAPYRNVALGLWKAYEAFPKADWFCYTEADCLFTSSSFKKNLLIADRNDVWLLGNDTHRDKYKFPLIEAIIKEKINCCYYVLGCCVFYCKEFIERLMEINFFERLINVSQHFTQGFFPNYTGHDLSEHLYPTLAVHFGGDVGSFAKFDLPTRMWTGNFRKFPVRWMPELDVSDVSKDATIAHPVKDYFNPIRVEHREKRKNDKIQTSSSRHNN